MSEKNFKVKNGLQANTIKVVSSVNNDGIIFQGRDGGSSNYSVTVTTDVLTNNRQYTLPDVAANAAFIMTEGTQNINGLKSFYANVGIGTNSASEKLHVAGNIRVANAYVDATNSTGSAGQVLTSNSTHAYWQAVGSATNLVLTGSVTEDVFTVTDGASVSLDPTNGSIQLWTLGGNRTPDQANWATGQGITLMVDDGTAYSITWSTLGVVWKTDAGVAPTLNTSGFTVIALWKVDSTIYGARVGNA